MELFKMRLILVFVCYYFHVIVVCDINSTFKRTIEDDYYLNYDYEIPTNNSVNYSFKSDSLILPNPDNIESKYTIDDLPNIDLPDDSLADTDLRDHDFIDNLMYVYYGSHSPRATGNYGPEVIIIGSVLSCAAQLLTIFCVLLKKNNKSNGIKDMKRIFLHLMGSFCFSNLIFMLGVYATKNSIKCLIIALVLHYLHLLTAFWMFSYCYYIYKRFSSGIPRIKYFFCTAYGLPVLFTVVSYLVTPHSFETKRFCFMSVQKGMIINYMLPVSLLIVLTTIYSLNGIRKINIELSKLELNSSAESLNALRNELDTISDATKRPDYIDDEVLSLRESKNCLKLLCVLQTGYDIVWFVAVLALENNTDSNSMSIVYAVTSCVLNWYIFIRTKSFLPTMANAADDDLETGGANAVPSSHYEEKQYVGSTGAATTCISARGSSDTIPLLVNAENCTEMRELRLDYISTISN